MTAQFLIQMLINSHILITDRYEVVKCLMFESLFRMQQRCLHLNGQLDGQCNCNYGWSALLCSALWLMTAAAWLLTCHENWPKLRTCILSPDAPFTCITLGTRLSGNGHLDAPIDAIAAHKHSLCAHWRASSHLHICGELAHSGAIYKSKPLLRLFQIDAITVHSVLLMISAHLAF